MFAMQTAILEANSDRLVILDFFAPWCASCKGLYPKLSKMCEENPQIVIAKVNFEENKDLAKKLGVKVCVPHSHPRQATRHHGTVCHVACL
jgi:thiol-disulfide isomerase/thioredoxin